MADVALAAGVSKNTVSLALRGDPQIPPKTRTKIKRAAERLGYQRNPVVGELMARMRRSGQPKFRATLALVNANRDPEARVNHPTIPVYMEGCERRAAQLGYALDPFWMHQKGGEGERLATVFQARGIRGVVIVGMMEENRLPAHFLPVVERFPCVVTGVRTREPALSFACTDHHILALRAVERARELGYRRPALVLDQVIDDLIEGRLASGFLIGQEALPKRDRLPPFRAVAEARQNPKVFLDWVDKNRPDVVFTLYNVVRRWLEEGGRRIPEDIGLIQLEWRGSRPEIAGMNQHNDLAGEAAIDMLISLIHNAEAGIPEFPRATLIGPSWVEGKSVRKV